MAIDDGKVMVAVLNRCGVYRSSYSSIATLVCLSLDNRTEGRT